MRLFLLPAACALLPFLAGAQDSVSLASKSISQVHAVQNRVFAFAEGGATYSSLDLFGETPQIRTREWTSGGEPEGGAAWDQSLLLRSNFWISDSQRVAHAAALRYDGSVRGADSLIFRDPIDTAAGLADGAPLSALAIRAAADTIAVLGFGRLGIAYSELSAQTASRPLADDSVRFMAFPADVDTVLELFVCRWNSSFPCRVDTVASPEAGLDSVTAVAIDSSAPDSVWLLIGTQRGVRRGLWGGNSFPYVPLPGVDAGEGVTVRSLFTSPPAALAWAFTGTRHFFSEDHGASFRDSLERGSGASTHPASLRGYAAPPQAAFYGDTTFINLNLTRPGLVAFLRDTLLGNSGQGSDGGDVRIDFEDGLDIRPEEGALTGLAVARQGTRSVLVVGSALKGVFYRELDSPDTTFENLNRLRVLRGALEEVITYPTLFTGATSGGGEPDYVRIGYRLSRDARVTITVYNYAMERVRVIVRNVPRRGGIARSENVAEDRWDGRDESGRLVSAGTYYVLVESDRGERAFGKVIATRGRR